MGFDVVYLPPDPPDRPHRAQGPGQRAGRGPRRPGQPLGHRRAPRAATPRCIRSSARSTTFARSSTAAAGPRASRSRSTSRSSARRITRGCASIPEWFYQRPGRHHQVRGEPAQEVPGHLPDQLLVRRPGSRSGTRCWASCCFWIDAGRADLPRRQPAHQAARLLGVADPRGAGRAHPDVVFLVRGVHAAQGDAGARQGRLHASPIPTSPGATSRRSSPSTSRSSRAPRWPSTSAGNLFAEHARHPARDPAARRPARLPDAGGPGRHARRRSGASTAASSSARPRPCPAPRSTGTRRSTRSGVRELGQPGQSPDYIARLNAIRRENPALQATRNLRFYPADSPHVLFYGKMTPAPGQRRPGRGQPRPVRRRTRPG